MKLKALNLFRGTADLVRGLADAVVRKLTRLANLPTCQRFGDTPRRVASGKLASRRWRRPSQPYVRKNGPVMMRQKRRVWLDGTFGRGYLYGMRILIAGVGKSGTTALAYAVKASMPADTTMLFEPRQAVAVKGENVIAKVLLNPRHDVGEGFFQQFDRIVMIVRDPRDVAVSKVLYRAYGEQTLHAPANLQRFLTALKQKEQSPRSVSVSHLSRMLYEFSGQRHHRPESLDELMAFSIDFHQRHPNALVYRYEQMVSGDFRPVAGYLRLDVEDKAVELPSELKRVSRSKRAENWRHWFCPEDVAFYRPLLRRFMDHFGYADEWELAERPWIDPAESSDYVKRLVDGRMEQKAR